VHEAFPCSDTVAQAVAKTGANTSVIFVPPAGRRRRILEAADAGIELIVCITEGHSGPRHGSRGNGPSTLSYLHGKPFKGFQNPSRDGPPAGGSLGGLPTRCNLVGPNCPGVITPGRPSWHHARLHSTSQVRLASSRRSGTLTYEAGFPDHRARPGTKHRRRIGGDPVKAWTHRLPFAV